MLPEPGNKKKYILLACLLFLVLFGRAQSSLIFYSTEDQFNSSNFNPAFLTSQKNFTFSIFPLSGMSVGYNNQDVVRDMLMKVLRGDSIKDAMTEVFNQLVQRGVFYQRFESSLLNFGVDTKYGNFNFRIKEIEQLMSNLKGDFSDFITDPNYNTLFINRPQKFPMNMIYYREYSLGYAREIIPHKLSVGVRAKLYYGKFTASSGVQGELTKVNNNFYLNTSGSVKLSIPLNIVQTPSDSIITGGNLADNFKAGDFLLNTKNRGVGIDLGFKYILNDELTISASIIDLGKISWKNNLNTVNYVGKYRFPDEYTDTEATGNDHITKQPSFAQDTTFMTNALFKASISHEAFSNPLPAVVYGAIQYQLNPKLNIGLVDRYIRFKGMSFNSISVTGTFNWGKNITVNTGYSIIGNSYFNFPFGIVRNSEKGQFYIGTDNLLSFVLPGIHEFSGITFGTCFYLFRKNEKYLKRLEYLPFYERKKAKPNKSRGLVF
ncbi:MAG: DUF5723 family protein [Prolixibacteraceae bacterium]|jgi:hypothetical protein